MPSNWTQRSTAPGVFLAMRLDQASHLEPASTPVRAYGPYGIHTDAWNGQPNVSIDSADAPPGGSASMLFQFNQLAGAMPGEWFSNASHDGSIRFNEGDTFFVQFRAKWSANFDDQVILTADGCNQSVVNNPFTTTNGSSIVAVDLFSGSDITPPIVGAWLCFSNASAVGGLDMNGVFQVTEVTGNTFKVQANGTASSAVTGGGQVAFFYGFTGEEFRVAKLGANPFQTQAGSSTVTVTDPGHGFANGGFGLLFTGAATVGGLDMNRGFQVASVLDANRYTVTHTQTASASATGGDSLVGRCRAPVSTGVKIFDIVAEDQFDFVGGEPTSVTGYGPNHMHTGSSDRSKIVTIWGHPGKQLSFYHYYPFPSDEGLVEIIPGDQRTQTEFPACTFTNQTGYWMQSPGCQGIVLGEWLTFTLQVTLGPATTALVGAATVPVWANSELKWWMAREGQASVLIHHYHAALNGFQHLLRYTNENMSGTATDFFKVYLFPYWNKKLYVQPTVNGPITVRYAELIGSTQAIDDPLDSGVSGVNASLSQAEQDDTLTATFDARSRVVGDGLVASVILTDPSSSLPIWVPQPGYLANVNLNTMRDVNPCGSGEGCTYSGVEGQGGLFDWCGGSYCKEMGAYGSLIMHGGGHEAYYGNEVYNFDFETRSWSRNFNGNVSVPLPAGVNAATPIDQYGEVAPGVPVSSHTYQHLQPLPSEWGGGALGSTLLVHISSGGPPIASSAWSHRFDHSTGTWSRYPTDTSGLAPSVANKACFDTTRGVHWTTVDGTQVAKLTHLPAPAWQVFSVPSGGANFVWWNSVAAYCPTLDVMIVFDIHSSFTNSFNLWYLPLSNLAAGWTLATHTGFTDSPLGAGPSIEWVPELGRFAVYDSGEIGNGQSTLITDVGNSFVRWLTPPATLGGDWTFTTETFTPLPGNPTPGIYKGEKSWENFGRMRWIPSLKSLAWFDSVYGPVQLLRPQGT